MMPDNGPLLGIQSQFGHNGLANDGMALDQLVFFGSERGWFVENAISNADLSDIVEIADRSQRFNLLSRAIQPFGNGNGIGCHSLRMVPGVRIFCFQRIHQGFEDTVEIADQVFIESHILDGQDRLFHQHVQEIGITLGKQLRFAVVAGYQEPEELSSNAERPTRKGPAMIQQLLELPFALEHLRIHQHVAQIRTAKALHQIILQPVYSLRLLLLTEPMIGDEHQRVGLAG